MARKPQLLMIFVVVGLFAAGAALLAGTRPVDGDEGYYAGAARLTASGLVPYGDFFYPQTPVLPYVYAPFSGPGGGSLVGLRMVSVAAAALGLLLLGSFLRRMYGSQSWLPVAGVLLVALDPHFLSWNVTVKTYALANLGVFGVLWALGRGWQTRSVRWFAGAGVMAGLVVGVRLLYAVWAGALVLAVAVTYLVRERPRRPGAVTGLIGGLVLGTAPVWGLLLRDPDRFMFNNLRYHVLRYSPHDAPGAGPLDQGLDALAVFAGTVATHPYLLVWLLLAGWGWREVRRGGEGSGPHAWWAAGFLAYTGTCLLPDPVYPQYFTAAWGPLLVPLAVRGLAALLAPTRRRLRPWLVAGAVVVVLAGLSGFELGVRRTGMDTAEVWSLDHQAKVAAAIERLTRPGDVVLAFWSGYPFISGRGYLEGMENHFALGISEQLTLEQKIHYHVVGKELLMEAFTRQAPAAVVLGGWMHEINTRLDQDHIPVLLEELQRRYEIRELLGEVKVMTPRREPEPES
ncbi:glycosyltransferase family 39 protein [bacterium]|nr:glycosyltransferase family 39 protein [bacterium]